MDKSRFINLELALHWADAHASHTERHVFERVNLWRDFLPGDLAERIAAAIPAPVSDEVAPAPLEFDAVEPALELVSDELAPGELVAPVDPALRRRVRAAQFRSAPRPGLWLHPQRGRFYPLNLLEDVSGFFPQDRRPFRVLDMATVQGTAWLDIDINHPLVSYPLRVSARVLATRAGKEEHGGRCQDLGEALCARGPGFQAPLREGETDYFGSDPFARMDPRPDAQFYREPRLVQHIDAAARAAISKMYGRFLSARVTQAGDTRPLQVLDLMSSWVSHLPETPMPRVVTGLGLNEAELARNPQLHSRIVHDLNAEADLPFDDASFDIAVCTVSVEYLVRPFAVFAEVARVLRPGAPFIVTFSERWFPSKAIQCWSELHPFERIGLASDYFRKSGFVQLGTESLRGLPRPADDPYADRLAHADPVYAVWGQAPG